MSLSTTLNSKTVVELRDLAAQFRIPRRSTMKKLDLVDVLSSHEYASRVELRIAIDEVTPEQQAAYAEQYNAARAKIADDNHAVGESATRKTALITRDVEGAAFFDITDGPGGVIVRYGRVFELVTGSGETITIRARSMVKAVKRLAVKLGIHLDAIDVVKAF
jgi:hypothetical protein